MVMYRKPNSGGSIWTGILIGMVIGCVLCATAALVIKGAAADGTVYDAEGAKKLADLKSRPQLLAEFAGDIKASMAKAAYLFNALPTKAVRTIDALREKQEKAA